MVPSRGKTLRECGNYKLESECQQHSNNHSLRMYGLDFGFILCYCHELRKKPGKELLKYPLFAVFKSLLLDKSNMVNDVTQNDDFACSNPVSWRCGL
jgi:hypothetical protein